MAATLQFRLTTNNLGGAATTTQISGTAMNNLFDNVSPDEAIAGKNEYRALDIFNAGDDTATVVTFYGTGTTSPGTDLLFALEAVPLGSTTAIADESTAPAIAGDFTAYTAASKLAVPDIPAGGYARFWLKRTVAPATGNLATDTTTLSIDYA